MNSGKSKWLALSKPLSEIDLNMLVLTQIYDDGTALVTLNRPEAMNALSRALRRTIAETFAALSVDESVRAIVLTGAGRAFTAGLDLKELGQTGLSGDDEETVPDPVRAIEGCGKPVIGAINGAAITGGFEVALACDILIGSEHARFADTHSRVGILPGWGLSQKLSRLVGLSRAKEISLTGNFIDAATAERWGLLNRVVPATELVPVALALAADIASAPAGPTAVYKKLIDDGATMTLGEALTHESRVTTTLNQSVNADEIARSRLDVTARGRQLTR